MFELLDSAVVHGDRQGTMSESLDFCSGFSPPSLDSGNMGCRRGFPRAQVIGKLKSLLTHQDPHVDFAIPVATALSHAPACSPPAAGSSIKLHM